MAGGVDQVELIDLAVLRLVEQGCGLGLDGDAALALQVHRVEHLRFHFAVGQAPAGLNEAVGQRGFAVVDVGDDGEVADVAHRFCTLRWLRRTRGEEVHGEEDLVPSQALAGCGRAAAAPVADDRRAIVYRDRRLWLSAAPARRGIDVISPVPAWPD